MMPLLSLELAAGPRPKAGGPSDDLCLCLSVSLSLSGAQEAKEAEAEARFGRSLTSQLKLIKK